VEPFQWCRLLQLVDHRDGEILHRNPALAALVFQQLILAEAVFAEPLARREQRAGRDEHPIELLLAAQHLQEFEPGRGLGFATSGKVGAWSRSAPGATSRLLAPPTRSSRFTPARFIASSMVSAFAPRKRTALITAS
jgi:hypothetical protein